MNARTDSAASHGRARTFRMAVATMSVATLIATAASAAGWAAATRLTGNISTVDAFAHVGSARPSKAPVTTQYEPINLLIMGTDTRTGQGGGFGSAATTASGNGHSDTTILLHIAGDRSRALGVSIPRDSWVTRPECGNGNSKISGKFNNAFAVGGPACTIKAVESLTGVRIDHFVVVDFKGFEAVVNAVGGVPICLKQAVDDPKSKLKLSAGEHLLNGTQALAFARARKTLGDGSDISRIDRQQVFLSSLLRKVTSRNVLTDLPTLFSVLNAITGSLTTDPSLGSIDSLQTLAASMTGLTPSKVAFVTVPWKPRGDGANVIWDTTKADVIWNSMTKDIPWPPKTPTGSGGKPLVTAPSKISVRVLNGTGIAGRGSAAAAQLRAEGFVVVSVANAPTSNYAKTTVLYSPSYDQSARTVIFATKAKVSTASGTGKILTVIVGTDWSGVRHVSIPSNSGSSGGSTNPTPKPADQSTCVG